MIPRVPGFRISILLALGAAFFWWNWRPSFSDIAAAMVVDLSTDGHGKFQ